MTDKHPSALAIASASAAAVVALASFTVSFDALHDVAESIRVSPAWMWPILLDGTISVALICALAVRGSSRRSIRLYPWVVGMTATAISVAANSWHATGQPINDATAGMLGSVAPLCLAASVHMVVIALDHSPQRTAVPRRRTASVSQTPSPALTTPRQRGDSGGAQRRAQGQREEVLAWVRAQHAEKGEWPTRATVADLLQQTGRSASRLLAFAKSEQGSADRTVK